MTINGHTLFELAPIEGMLREKVYDHGVSHGRSEAGYDIRIREEVRFHAQEWTDPYNGSKLSNAMIRQVTRTEPDGTKVAKPGRFIIASTIERFQMPDSLIAIVHDKSSWARKGLSVFNTVIESGWCGFLTLELVYHGEGELLIPAGAGIAQVIFSSVSDPVSYRGRYQGQENRPVEAIDSKLSA